MRIADFGDFIAYVIVPLSLVLSWRFVLPALSGQGKIYYIFLMSWSVPYVIGNVCDSNKIGPRWVQWYLLDISFEPWATTFWVAVIAAIITVARRTYTQRSIWIWSVASLATTVILAVGYEMAQSLWGQFPSIDWSDYSSYVIGTIAALTPSIAFKQLRLAPNAQIS